MLEGSCFGPVKTQSNLSVDQKLPPNGTEEVQEICFPTGQKQAIVFVFSYFSRYQLRSQLRCKPDTIQFRLWFINIKTLVGISVYN